ANSSCLGIFNAGSGLVFILARKVVCTDSSPHPQPLLSPFAFYPAFVLAGILTFSFMGRVVSLPFNTISVSDVLIPFTTDKLLAFIANGH
ncbi:MAG: hypothetical protein FWC45_08430, partial [Treponema sp.]|nr:hypothetical protein [Treponema sp.]